MRLTPAGATALVPADSERPVPPEELIWRVTGTKSTEWFLESGRQSAHEVNGALGLLGSQFTDYPRMLEFGCGCGRILLWMEDVAQSVELIGTDIDEDAIAWARKNVPYATFLNNQGLPPVDLPDGHLDLVFNHSVFTHLDENYQDAWLAELRRMTKPGGTVLLTVAGEYAFESGFVAWGTDAIRRDWEDKGFIFIADDAWTGGPFPDFYHSAFHAPWYLFRQWTRFFDIKAYIPRASLDFQDFVLLQRPSEG